MNTIYKGDLRNICLLLLYALKNACLTWQFPIPNVSESLLSSMIHYHLHTQNNAKGMTYVP